MTIIIHDQMHKFMDAFVNNIVVKSKEDEIHIDDLTEVFKLFLLYKIKLNLEVCISNLIRQTYQLYG